MILEPSRKGEIPPRALAFSVAALMAPVLAAFFVPEALEPYAPLLWLSALLPGFLLAYYRGWQGVATSLALGMAALSLTQAASSALGNPIPDLLLPVVVVYLGISLAIGWLAEQLRKEREEATDLAFTDTLTGLPNRRQADIFLRDEFAAARRGRNVAVVLFDIDHFKRYNDTQGHAAGDAALQAFADVLRANTRRMNLAARFGGEEFLAVLAGSNPQGAYIFADRVRAALEARGIGDPPLTVTGGIAVSDSGTRDPAHLLAAADEALYEAKREGRNRIRVAGGLPDEAVLPPSVPGRRAGSPPPLPRPVVGARALLVDGEPEILDVLASHLRHRGFEVETATDLPAAVGMLAREFAVVVTDLHLPGGSGTELLREARARWPRIGVVILTAVQDAHKAAEALNAGADAWVFKPLSLPDFDAQFDRVAARDRVGSLAAPGGVSAR